jgi:hypothetical protein
LEERNKGQYSPLFPTNGTPNTAQRQKKCWWKSKEVGEKVKRSFDEGRNKP